MTSRSWTIRALILVESLMISKIPMLTVMIERSQAQSMLCIWRFWWWKWKWNKSLKYGDGTFYVVVIQWIRSKDLGMKLPAFNGEFPIQSTTQPPRTPMPLDFFNLLFTSGIVDYLLDQANLYRTQEDFKQKTMDRLAFYRLLRFLFYSSLIRLSLKSDYWSSACGPNLFLPSNTRDRPSRSTAMGTSSQW